jgi:hypothetical protein
MNLIETLRVAGSRIFPVRSPDARATLIERNRRAERAAAAGHTIAKYIRSQGMDAEGLAITYQPLSQTLFVYGTVTGMQTRDRILVCCNQVARVARVVDRMQVIANPAEPGLKLAR